MGKRSQRSKKLASKGFQSTNSLINEVDTTRSQLEQLYHSSQFQTIISKASLELTDRFDLYDIFAASCFMANDYNTCIDFCVSGLSHHSKSSAFLSIYATALRRAGRLEESSQIFENAIADNVVDDGLLNNYSNLLIDLKQFDKAENIE